MPIYLLGERYIISDLIYNYLQLRNNYTYFLKKSYNQGGRVYNFYKKILAAQLRLLTGVLIFILFNFKRNFILFLLIYYM